MGRGNMNTLKTAWTPVFELAETASTGSVSDAPGAGDFLVSMMSVQQALRKCNIGPAQEAMLIDAWEEGGSNLKTKLSVPNENIKTSDVAQLLSSALEDFKRYLELRRFEMASHRALMDPLSGFSVLHRL